MYVHCVVFFPRVVTHPIDASAAAPFSALFNCSVQAYGDLTITWYRKNNTVSKKAYSALIQSANGSTSILTIPNVTSKDVGTYYCEARTQMLVVQSGTANLFLAGKVCTSA